MLTAVTNTTDQEVEKMAHTRDPFGGNKCTEPGHKMVWERTNEVEIRPERAESKSDKSILWSFGRVMAEKKIPGRDSQQWEIQPHQRWHDLAK